MYDQLAKQQMEAGYAGAQLMNPSRPTQRETLERRKAELSEQLRRVEHALEMLDKNPGFEEVMNAVMQATY